MPSGRAQQLPSQIQPAHASSAERHVSPGRKSRDITPPDCQPRRVVPRGDPCVCPTAGHPWWSSRAGRPIVSRSAQWGHAGSRSQRPSRAHRPRRGPCRLPARHHDELVEATRPAEGTTSVVPGDGMLRLVGRPNASSQPAQQSHCRTVPELGTHETAQAGSLQPDRSCRVRCRPGSAGRPPQSRPQDIDAQQQDPCGEQQLHP